MRRFFAVMLPMLASCNLDETTVPEGEVVLVVHSVMRPDLPTSFNARQFVVVERTFAGDIAPTIDSVTGDTTFHDPSSAGLRRRRRLFLT